MREKQLFEELGLVCSRLAKSTDPDRRRALLKKYHELVAKQYNLAHPDVMSKQEAFIEATFAEDAPARLGLSAVTLRVQRSRVKSGALMSNVMEDVLTRMGYKCVQEELWGKK